MLAVELVAGAGGAMVVTPRVTRSQQPVPMSGGESHSVLRAGAYWTGLGRTEKEAYISGFLAGALSEQVRTIAVAEHREADSASVRSAVADSLRASHAVRFPFAATLYVAELDDFYWWENHATIPIVDALIQVNAQLDGQRAKDPERR